jgi:hypothetical protein
MAYYLGDVEMMAERGFRFQAHPPAVIPVPFVPATITVSSIPAVGASASSCRPQPGRGADNNGHQHGIHSFPFPRFH